MAFLNVEIKAHSTDSDRIRQYLLDNGAEFRGVDEQTDTYFSVRKGRLKLREGQIENNLIYYERNDQAGPKESSFRLVKIDDPIGLKEVLADSVGVKVVVHKKREIYFIKNIKFHLDLVPGLGNFVEIEASNLYADKNSEELHEQCNFYISEFGIKPDDLVHLSYSDMLM